MPQINTIGVRFMRKIQVRDYEPAECEVTLSASILQTENPETVTKALIAFASEEVHEALGMPRSTTLAKPGASRGVGQKVTTTGQDKVPDQTKTGKVGVVVSATDEIPGEGAPATSAKTASATDDIPGEGAPATQAKPTAPVQQAKPTAPAAPETGEPALDAAGLSKWIGDQVKAGKITSVAVKALYPKFGVTRLVDLKPEQVAACKTALDAAISEHSAADGL